MDMQTAFNIAVMICAALGGWWMRAVWESLSDLRSAHTQLIDRVQKIEVLVAGEYVTREELSHALQTLFRKLDKIEDKLDGKQDRSIHAN